jgi:cytohesin
MAAALQRGLFEEEANRNFPAAIQAYQAVVEQFDKDRRLAATAIFRLGECYRKQGKTNEAVVQFERVLKDFSEQEAMVALSRQNLAAMKGQANIPTAKGLAGSKAAEDVELAQIQNLIKENPDLINGSVSGKEPPPLHTAVTNDHFRVIDFLIKNGANINQAYEQDTALSLAVELGKRPTVELLLKNGADVQKGRGSVTPLHLAAARGFKAIAEVLLENGAQVNATDFFANTPLYRAVEAGHKNLVELLLERKANPNPAPLPTSREGISVNQTTPLRVAVVAGREDLVQALIKAGADVNARENDGSTPLKLAVAGRNLAIVRLLLENKANPNVSPNPLFTAAQHPSGEMVKLLLAYGADPNGEFALKISKDPDIPLLAAVQIGAQDSAFALLDAKADPNLTNQSGATPLHLALGQEAVFKRLIKEGAAVNVRDRSGETPLHYAVGAGLTNKVRELLELKADPNVRDSRGFTPLHWAVALDRADTAALLLDNGALVNMPDINGMPPLYHAARIQHTWQRVTVAIGLPVSKPNNLGSLQNPRGDTELITLLRSKGGREELVFPNRISVRRPGGEWNIEVFNRSSESSNTFTLLELLAHSYSQINPFMPGRYQRSDRANGLAFPDFAKIRIITSSVSGTNWMERTVNVDEILDGGACEKDQPLNWGDVIEIPEANHLVTAKWEGLTQAQKATLAKCLRRTVQVIIQGKTNQLVLSTVSASETNRLNNFFLNHVLANSGLLLASSDLSRVKVTRAEKNGQPGGVQILRVDTFNLWSDEGPQLTSLWLRDGDVIEVPDKQ